MLNFFGEVEAHAGDQTVLGALIAVGLFECFFGLKFFRPTLFVFGFCSGFIFASSIAASHLDSDTDVYMASGITGLVMGLLAVCIVSMGLAMLGTFLGVSIVYVTYMAFLHDITSHTALFYAAISIAGLIGGYIGYRASRFIVILATSIGGSLIMCRSMDMLANNEISIDAVKNAQLSDEGWGLVVGFGVLSLGGTIFQARSGHRVPRRHSEKLLG